MREPLPPGDPHYGAKTLQTPVILSVDDHEGNQYVRSRILRGAGFAVVEAATGAEALRLAVDECPSLVVLDIRLPDLNGFEVCRRLKSDPRTKGIPVLHVSALGRAEVDMPEALAHQSDAYLREPIDPDTLVATARALIGRKASEQALERERELLQGIVENIPVMLCLYDPALQKFELNRESERVLGWTTDDANEGDFMAKVYPDPTSRAEVAEYMQSLAPGWREFDITARDGSLIPSEWANVRLPDNRMIGIGIDVRERKRAEEERLRASRRLQAVLDSITDGLLVLDKDWRCTYSSEQGARMIGMRPEELVGRCVWELFPEANGTKFHEGYHRAVETGQPVHFEEFYPAPLNKWLECHCYPSAEGLSVYFHDITGRKRAEQALRESEERYRTLFNSIDQGFCIIEMKIEPGEPRDYRFIEVNQAFEKQSTLANATGKWMRELRPGHEEKWFEIYGEVALTGEPIRFDERGQELENRWFEVYAFRMGAPGEKRVGVLFTDISERKRAEQALRASEERYRTLFTSMNEGFALGEAICDENGSPIDFCFIEMNDAFERQSGLGREILGRPMRQVLPNLEQVWIDRYCHVALAGEQVRFEEYNRDTNRHYSVFCYSPSQGRFAILFRDITVIKRAQEELRESERQFRELADFMPQLVWMAGATGSVTYFNRRWYEQIGVGPDESLGGRWLELLHPDDRSRTSNCWHSCLATGEPLEIECRFRVATGEYRWFLSRAAPIRDEQGRITRWFGTCTDIEDSKRAEERLRQTQKLESIGLLAGGIAHDFNNLLTGIMGNASLVLDDIGPGPAERIQEVIAGAERAASLTSQLLAYSGKGRFIVRDVDVSQAVQEIGDLVQFSIPKSVNLAINVEKRLPTVRMDPSQLQQILMNLVINAGEAVGEGNPGRVTVSTAMKDVEKPFVDALGQEVAAGRYLSIQVADTGGGIDHAAKSRIFDPFFTTKFTGRGLGLAATAGIVRSQNGAITVESAPGGGSTFGVLLPVAGGLAQDAREQPGAEARGTVLVVDDEAAVRDFIAAAIRRQGYRVLMAADGRDALAVCDREGGRIDLAITDVVMPIMGAGDFLPLMRARQPKMKILLTSGYSESEARRLCAAYPGAAFIQKPYTARQIAKAADELLGGTPQ